MSFLYPRLVSLARQNADNAIGEQPYSGETPSTETVIVSGLAARIQADRQGTVPVAKLPSDTAGQSIWLILIKKAALGLVVPRDILIDDLGNRYQVISAEWAQFETTCRSQILET
jgi:hypothetical protein